jgi:FixJ family two-component response regulator
MEGESKLEKGEKTSGTKRPLISIVDDDGALRSSLEDLMRSVGFRVQVFSSAETFLRSNQAQTTDCLILDVRMPGMTGPRLQRDLRSKRADLPIIFITAYANAEVRAQVLEAGAVAFLYKPFYEEDLLGAINAALRDG